KIDDCEKLLFDPIAVKRLRMLARCPSATGLTGKVNVVFEVDFGKKEVSVKKAKKAGSLPASTVSGIVACAGKDFANVSLEEVPPTHRLYPRECGLSCDGRASHPGAAAAEGGGGDGDPAAGSTTSEAEASGSATVAWDTALLRKEPKDGEVVARIVRGTKV